MALHQSAVLARMSWSEDEEGHTHITALRLWLSAEVNMPITRHPHSPTTR